ncbi:molybdate ABC transporter substrate-binding protein [Photobacterium atrarenae]|uniref:Molybdate ABC transporter substrate-binding protein n=1 Tax=Photobacterium atrarenae TaxID=865757 RepID=A0ABY5GRK3_9GAMM|nr:molybdate ABC transporter substrate-binding protein [Photobacterium atrarenae]UTV30898.1 molybdate ABC transporter substrate-binding protein [Photobacterium atrarenae]
MKSGLFACCAFVAAGSVSAAEKVTVFAAASLTNAMKEVAALYEQQTGTASILSFASSSALARQIAQGAPADIYLSANEKWMDYVEQQKAIEPDSRKALLTNSLVMVAPESYLAEQIEISASWDLTVALQGTRLATGDPNHVPAGMYAKQSLENLGLWPQAMPLLARANNVRSALLLVEREEALLGIVYKTDALVSEKVKIVAELPASSHTPITYPTALVKGQADAAARAYFDFLQSEQAQMIFEKYGFGVAARAH